MINVKGRAAKEGTMHNIVLDFWNEMSEGMLEETKHMEADSGRVVMVRKWSKKKGKEKWKGKKKKRRRRSEAYEWGNRMEKMRWRERRIRVS